MKTPIERLDSYILGLFGLSIVGLFFGIGAVIFASAQFELGGWLVVGWALTAVSALALLVAMIGHAIHLAAQSIIDAFAGSSAEEPTVVVRDSAASN